MLESIRNATRSWYVRGFLILLASTFALFFGSGGSMFSGIANQPVATIGKYEISQTEFADAYVRKYSRLEGRLSPDQARQLGLPIDTLRELVGGALLDNAARELGIAVPNSMLAANIRAEVGNVTPTMYRDILRQEGYNVESFEALVRRELARGQILSTVAPSEPPVPNILVDTLYRYRQESRVASVVTIPATAAGDIAPPELSVLTAYHADNQHRYTAPEFREVVFVSLVPEDVLDSIGVTDEEIADEYELRIGSYTTPDRRDLSQLFFSDVEAAQAALRRIENGIAFHMAAPGTRPLPTVEEVVEELAAQPDAVLAGPLAGAAAIARTRDAEQRVLDADLAAKEAVRLGWMERRDLPEAVTDVVFATEGGDLTQPLQSAFGWHIYRVNAVEHGGTRTLDEARDEIRETLAREKAIADLFNMSIALDDALAAGDSLEEVAIRMGLSLGRATIDATGAGPDGANVVSLPTFARFLPAAFETNEGRESRLTDTAEGGYFVLRVDRVDPPRPKTYNEVAAAVVADWISEERNRIVQEIADLFVQRAELLGISEAADAEGYKITTTAPFTRDGVGMDVPTTRKLISQLFSAAVSELVVAPAPESGFHVAMVTTTIAADMLDAREILEQLRAQLASAMSADLLSQYDNSLEATYGINVNNRALDQALEAATQALPVPLNL